MRQHRRRVIRQVDVDGAAKHRTRACACCVRVTSDVRGTREYVRRAVSVIDTRFSRPESRAADRYELAAGERRPRRPCRHSKQVDELPAQGKTWKPDLLLREVRGRGVRRERSCNRAAESSEALFLARRQELAIPAGALLVGAPLGGVVDVHDPEASRVPVVPFEVVHE